MAWLLKGTVSCATSVLLLALTLEVMGYTLWMCQQDCKDQPDDPVCGRRNFTMEDQHRTKSADYQWLKNECERKCFSKGDYERVGMELCTKNGQTRMTYICSEHDHPTVYQRCMKNESLYGK